MPKRKISDTLSQVSVQMTTKNLEVLDYLANKQVLSRSAIIRQLIDKAAEEIDWEKDPK